jgi:hypothetical protein
VLELPEFAWDDIEEVLCQDIMPFLLKRTINNRAMMKEGVEHIVRMVDAVRSKQAKEAEK